MKPPAPRLLHVGVAGPINHLSMRLTLGDAHCSGILTREPDRTWTLQWTTGDHGGQVSPMAPASAAWPTALRRALTTCETALIRRIVPK